MHIRVINDIYEGVETSVRTLEGNTKDFPIDIGLHQESALNLFFFTIIMDVLTKGIQDWYHGVCYLLMILFSSMKLRMVLTRS